MQKIIMIVGLAFAVTGCAHLRGGRSKEAAVPVVLVPAVFTEAVVQEQSDIAVIQKDYETVLWKGNDDVVPEGVWVVVQDEASPLAGGYSHQPRRFTRTIRFSFDRATLSASAKSIIRSLPVREADWIHVTGYTDSLGSKRYNDELSIRRARAVKVALVQKGFPADRISIDGEGESSPVASNRTEKGREKNRRAVIVLKLAEEK